MPVSKILLTSLLAVVLSPAPRAAGAFPPPAPPFSDSLSSKFNPGHRHIILIVWDGLRPDFVTEHNAPALCQLARNGVTFARHHSVYLSATEVNGTALSTGAYPAHNDIIGNNEYRPRIDPLSWVHTELPEVVHRGDELTHGHYLRRATIAQIVRQAGGKTAVAGAKPVTLLADRAPRSSDTTDGNVFGGSTLPPNLLAIITNHYGRFPDGAATEPTRNDWTTDAMIDPLWANGVPEFSLLWMNEPDFDQHQTGPGSSFDAWDCSTTFEYMPGQNITLKLEFVHRAVQNIGAAPGTPALKGYFAGPGGVTSPTGYANTGDYTYTSSGASVAPPLSSWGGWQPDMVKSETRIILAFLVRF